jgi:hypothetical protein
MASHQFSMDCHSKTMWIAAGSYVLMKGRHTKWIGVQHRSNVYRIHIGPL